MKVKHYYLAFLFFLQFSTAFAGPAEIARDALGIPAIQFNHASKTLTIIATSRDTVSKGQLRDVITLGYCDAIIGNYPEMNQAEIVNVINSAGTHGFVFTGGAKACEEIDFAQDNAALSDAILAYTIPYKSQ